MSSARMIKPGDVLKDNDPRMPNRKVRVVAVGDTHAICENIVGHRVSVKIARIHDDGKARRTGFSVEHPVKVNMVALHVEGSSDEVAETMHRLAEALGGGQT